MLLGAAALAAAGFAWRRRRHRRRARGPTDDLDRVFDDLVATLAAAGLERLASQTPSELLSAIAADRALPPGVPEQATVVVRTLERGRFAPPRERPDATELAQARVAAVRVRELIDAR
jgi:hypothetical protein